MIYYAEPYVFPRAEFPNVVTSLRNVFSSSHITWLKKGKQARPMRAFCESTPAIKVKRVELSPAVALSRPVSDFPDRFTATFLVHGPVTENAGENGQCEHTFIHIYANEL